MTVEITQTQKRVRREVQSSEQRQQRVDEDVAKMEGAGWNREIGGRLDKHVITQIRSCSLHREGGGA